MTEERTPYEAGTKANYYEISQVLNIYLIPELLKDVRYPKELDTESPDNLYTYTYHALIGPAAVFVAGSLGRQLQPKEIDFIQGRLEAFVKTQLQG